MKNLLTFLFTIITIAGFSQSITVTVGEKAAGSSNSDLLQGRDTAYFVDTATAQNIRGVKSFINRINLTDGLQFVPATGFSHSEGLLFYDSDTKTFSGFIDRTDVTLNIGEENWLRVVNKSGGDFTDGQVVYIDSAQGNRPTILLAKADALLTSQGTIAVLTENIDNNEEGIATTFGLVRGFNTTGFDPGDELFLSATTEGGIVNTKPTAPNFVIRIGWAINSMSNGSILVNISVYGDGSNNTFIDQDVTSGSSPTFDGTNFTAIAVDTITGDIATTQVAGFQDSVTANTNVTANTVHRTSDGSDHTFINQDVTSTGSPTFSTATITNNIQISGDTLFNGTDTITITEIAINRRAYADLHATDSSITLDMTQNTYTQVTNPSNTLLIADHVKNITSGGDSLVIIIAGTYRIDTHISIEGNASDVYEGVVAIDNVPNNNHKFTHKTASNDVVDMSFAGFYSLTVDQSVKMVLRNTSNNNDATIINACLILKRIDK